MNWTLQSHIVWKARCKSCVFERFRNILQDQQHSNKHQHSTLRYFENMKLSNRKPPKHYIASTRFDSDIPMPYFNWSWTLYLDHKPHNGKNAWSENNIQTPHVPFSKVKKAAVFIARNCHSKSKREDLVKSLMEKMTVDSVSSCLHNFDIDDKKNKVKMMRQYVVFERLSHIPQILRVSLTSSRIFESKEHKHSNTNTRTQTLEHKHSNTNARTQVRVVLCV